MDTDLKGRVALVTGSSHGLGRAIAEGLASEGVNVIINGRYSKTVGNTAFEIWSSCSYNIQAYQFTCDTTDLNRINKDIFNKKMSRIGQLDILVNNVGNIEKFGKFEDLEDEDWLRMHDLGCMSAVRFIRASLPYLKKSSQARIINISSLSGHQPSFTGLNPHYATTKAGVLALTKNLANDFGRYGITVNAICPSTLSGGGWDQNVIDRAGRQEITAEEAENMMRQEENKKSPLGKMGGLKDVANLVVFLSSSKAGFLTGHCYNVDGGITRSIL